MLLPNGLDPDPRRESSEFELALTQWAGRLVRFAQGGKIYEGVCPGATSNGMGNWDNKTVWNCLLLMDPRSEPGMTD